MQSILLGALTVTMILVGLFVICSVSFLPLIEFALLVPLPHDDHDHDNDHDSAWVGVMMMLVLVLMIQLVHLRLLWISTIYLSVFRALVYPVRQLVMPLAMMVVKIEAMREETPILYLDLARIEQQQSRNNNNNINNNNINNNNCDDNEKERLLRYFRQSIRRRYKKMEDKFREGGIILKSCRSESSLNLSEVVPIMWTHEQRCCERDGKSGVFVVIEEFMKRFLVMILTTHGILDLYYNQDELVCVQLSVQQADVLHWFMYFSIDSRSGIWYHGILNAMMRGLKTTTTMSSSTMSSSTMSSSSSSTTSIRYVNAQNHQTESKTGAGLRQCDFSDDDIMIDLYPWAFLRDLDESLLETKLWTGMETPSPPPPPPRTTTRTRTPRSSS